MRRRKAGAVKPKTVIASIAVCSAVALSGIGYVWAKTQVWGLSKEMKKLEGRVEEVKRVNEVLRRTYAAMCTPARLDARVKELQLDLVRPTPNQFVRLPEPQLDAEKQRDSRSYVARQME